MESLTKNDENFMEIKQINNIQGKEKMSHENITESLEYENKLISNKCENSSHEIITDSHISEQIDIESHSSVDSDATLKNDQQITQERYIESNFDKPIHSFNYTSQEDKKSLENVICVNISSVEIENSKFSSSVESFVPDTDITYEKLQNSLNSKEFQDLNENETEKDLNEETLSFHQTEETSVLKQCLKSTDLLTNESEIHLNNKNEKDNECNNVNESVTVNEAVNVTVDESVNVIVDESVNSSNNSKELPNKSTVSYDDKSSASTVKYTETENVDIKANNDVRENLQCSNLVREIKGFDGVSLCSSQSHDSGDESDTLLSELESELDGGTEESNNASDIQLNGIKPTLLQQTKHKRIQMHKDHSSKFDKLNAYTNKQAVEYYELQIEFLERANSQLRRELTELKEKLSNQDTEVKKQINQLKTELGTKLEKLQKHYEAVQKERDNMVLRYAQSERDVIILKKTRDELEKKLRDAAKDREGILNRVKSLNVEKARLCSTLDNKGAEIATIRRECEHLKEELNSRDIRIKWTQNKLKTEMDAHKETQTKLEHTILRLQETREEADQVRKDCQEMIRRYQDAEEIKSVSLDHQLRQKLSELEVQKQEKSDQEEVYQLVKNELEALKKKHKVIIEENNSLTLKIHILEKERLDHEQTVSKLKECQNTLRQEVVDLTGRLAEKENLEMLLEREKERVLANQKEVERFRQANAELQSDMEACRNKEGELLEFTERLTAKSVTLQSEHSSLEAKALMLEDEMNRINKLYTEQEKKNQELFAELEEEKKQHIEETQLLARKLAEKTKTVEQLTIKLDDSENENRVMKRRHMTSIKELSRELLHIKKRLEMYEFNQCGGDSLSIGSRTSSTGSLDTLTNNQSINHHISNQTSGPHIPPAVTFSGGKSSNSSVSTKVSDSKISPVQPQQNQNSSPPPNTSLVEVDKQMLIERIVKLQKILARKNEKIEFQEEHINHLLDEMKKKARIIQNYILREEAGALAPNSMDQNKADVAKRGGVMASVYRSHVADSHMTLELSLEINNKLQAVLEDTLLKNITLKENINTLGEEIARITKEHRLLHSQLTKCKNGK